MELHEHSYATLGFIYISLRANRLCSARGTGLFGLGNPVMARNLELKQSVLLLRSCTNVVNHERLPNRVRSVADNHDVGEIWWDDARDEVAGPIVFRALGHWKFVSHPLEVTL